MNIHLLRTPEYAQSDFLEVIELLQSFKGLMQFKATDHGFIKMIEENNPNLYNEFNRKDVFNNAIWDEMMIYNKKRLMPLSWQELFNYCTFYRELYGISNQDFIILLTPRRNVLNWFAAMDNDNKRNVFVQTSDWERFVQCPGKFPVAYEVVAYVLRNLMKLDVQNFQEIAHKKEIGCMNDFCQIKSKIILKLRTADICPDCQALLVRENVNPAIIQQALSIFEGIRKQMLFVQGFTNAAKLSRLIINGDYKLYLADYGNIEIKLTPIQKSIYFLFLNHPEGIKFVDLSDHADEIHQIYRELSPSFSDSKIKETINKICFDTRNGYPNLRTYISQIKSEFKKKIGIIGHAYMDQYCIQGEDGGHKKLAIDRSLISAHKSIGFLNFG